MPVRAIAERALVAAIVAQLSVAGVVVAAGGPTAEAATVSLERAEILDTVQLVDRDVHSAPQGTGPIVLAAPPAIAPPPTAPPTPELLSEPAPEAPPAPAPAAAPAAATTTTVAPPPSTTAPTTTAPPAPSTQTTAAGSSRDAPCETAMLGWMNDARAGAGVGALADDPVVDHVAFRWSDHLAATGELRHNPRYAEEVFAARPEAMTAGEVVGRGPEARAVFEEFLRSSTHRDAIVRRAFTRATVGCVRDGGGQLWVTANFWG